jgi:hypothetical protein
MMKTNNHKKAKNRLMLFTLLGLCLLFYVLTIVKMKGF